MTIDCSATAFVIRLGWILHLNHFIIYVPNSCQCHLEAVWLVIHHTLSFTVVINIVMGWTFTMKLAGAKEYTSPLGGLGQSKQDSTEVRSSGVLTRNSLEVLLAHFPSALFPPSCSALRFAGCILDISANIRCCIIIVLIHWRFSDHLPITSAACRQISSGARWHISAELKRPSM